MRRIITLSPALAFALASCGGPDTAAEAQEERAEALEEAAEVSYPAGAEPLENLAERHERKAERLEELPGELPFEAADTNAMAPIPDSVAVGEDG